MYLCHAIAQHVDNGRISRPPCMYPHMQKEMFIYIGREGGGGMDGGREEEKWEGGREGGREGAKGGGRREGGREVGGKGG